MRVRHGEPHSNFLIIFVFFFDRTELQNELNMMHSSDEVNELCSVDRFESINPKFGSIEFDCPDYPNRTFYKKKQK